MADRALDISSNRQIEHALEGRRSLPDSFAHHDRYVRAIIRPPDEAGNGASSSNGAHEEARPSGRLVPPASAAEAIVRLFNRPSMPVRGDRIVSPENDEWKRRLAIFRPLVEPWLRSVGRLRLENASVDWIGTAWVVGKNLAVTNRHLAAEFAGDASSKYEFLKAAFGAGLIEASVDFGWDEPPSTRSVRVAKVLYVAPRSNNAPDLAVLRLDGDVPPAIPLGDDPEFDEWVGVIGYPASDARNDAGAQHKVFGQLFNVKQFAPGQVMKGKDKLAAFEFEHDASTLGGNSGSVVLSLRDGHAVGLHLGGLYKSANYAVRASTIKRVLTGEKLVARAVAVPAVPREARSSDDPTHAPEFFKQRTGFDSKFLGKSFAIPWPELGAWKADVVPLLRPDRGNKHRLDYTHFSVIMCKSRRMALVTAVNIDGKQAKPIRRQTDQWFFDGRVAREHQIGNADAYTHNKLDRGHQVRREDPNWGAQAGQANVDTFHYTNSCPQHANLNQKTWLALEDFILGTAKTRDLKASVFTGPVLRDDDFPYRGIRVPSEFFKVVAVVDDASGELEVTAFLQSQTDYLGEDIDERVYDQGSTYQVPVTHIEEITGLGFRQLASHDPLKDRTEGVARTRFPGHRVRGPADIVRKTRRRRP